MACMLALGRGSSAASGASASRDVGLVAVERLSSSATPHAVLGERAGLVRAHHVDAGQALDRGQLLTRHWRRPSRTTPTAKAIDVISTRPSGTIGTSAPTIRSTDSRQPASVVNSWV